MGRLTTGLAGLFLSFWGLFEDVGFIAQPFYAYAWWSYILALDGFVSLRRKGSLLRPDAASSSPSPSGR
jgi:hypothetical protein